MCRAAIPIGMILMMIQLLKMRLAKECDLHNDTLGRHTVVHECVECLARAETQERARTNTMYDLS